MIIEDELHMLVVCPLYHDLCFRLPEEVLSHLLQHDLKNILQPEDQKPSNLHHRSSQKKTRAQELRNQLQNFNVISIAAVPTTLLWFTLGPPLPLPSPTLNRLPYSTLSFPLLPPPLPLPSFSIWSKRCNTTPASRHSSRHPLEGRYFDVYQL